MPTAPPLPAWQLASNSKAYVGVKFLDGPYQWDEKRGEAFPANFAGPGDTTRILLHAGDATTHGSFEPFHETLRANPLVVTADKADYRFGGGSEHSEMTRYDAASPASFTLPRINGTPADLRPPRTYQSPCLNSRFASDRIAVTVGPVRQVLEFSEQGE